MMMSSAVRITTLAWLTLSAAAFGAEPAATPPPQPAPTSSDRRPAQTVTEENPEEGEAPAASAQKASSPPTANRQPSSAARRTSADRLELDTSVVTGNRELPKVLYIVPWKKADLGELPGQPFNTLLDEVLAPVDRDVFRREVTYFEAVTRGADATQSTSAPQP